MSEKELIQAVRELQARPLVVLARTPAGKVRCMGLEECVRTGSAYLQLVFDDLDKLLEDELGGAENCSMCENGKGSIKG